MPARVTEDLARLYTRRHDDLSGGPRKDLFGDKPYANWGFWPTGSETIEEACDGLTDLVANAAKLGPGDKVLEVGCGYGASAVCYMRKYQPDSVVGVDATEVRVTAAREYIAEQGLADRIRVGTGDATALEFPDGSFDKVIAIECAFHFSTRLAFLNEAARVLAPGGMLGMTDIIPRRGTDLDRYIATVRFPVGSDGLDVPENAYDADVYEAHLRAAGFDEVRIESITERTLNPFADYLERRGNEIGGERGANFVRAANYYREFRDVGVDYVLVAARKG